MRRTATSRLRRQALHWVVASIVALGVASAAAASTTHDLTGSWSITGTNGAVPQTWNITSLDCSTGRLSGNGSGNGFTWPISGTVTGDSISMTTGPYKQDPTYTATERATIAPDNNSFSGPWSDNGGGGGMFTAKRTSGPNGGTNCAGGTGPRLAQAANASPVAGQVFVKLPGTTTFVPLSQAQQLPVGTVVDARQGTVKLVFAKKGGGTMTGEYWKGEFTFTQAKSGHVTVALVGPLGSTTAHGPIAIAARGRPGRSLWSNCHGNFTTRGHAASGSARGTKWLTQDYANGTRITVTSDVVLVTNLKTHQTQQVHAGHSVFVKG